MGYAAGVMALRPCRATAGAALLALAAWSGAAAADPAPLAYQVYFGGLKAMALQAELDLSGAAYRAKLTAHSEGMVGWLFSYTADARSDGGREVLQPSEYAAFSGEATLCLFRYIRIAGYQKPGSSRWSNPRDVERTHKVWLAPIAPGLPPLPVRIEAEGTFGTLLVHWIGPARPQG